MNAPSTESLTATLHPTGSHFKAIYFYARPNGQTFMPKHLRNTK
ncbi:endolytic transglycosylase MltG [Bacillus megaterium NBRC 15308 = ATCC 14581]|nr:endolytic transglycosylase MltG [Priestia megaterium NBRC 15308 = ATCC 14581]